MTPIRYFQITVMATVAYCAVVATDSLIPGQTIPPEAGGLIRTALAIAWVMSSVTVLADRYFDKLDARRVEYRTFLTEHLATIEKRMAEEVAANREFIAERLAAVMVRLDAIDRGGPPPVDPDVVQLGQRISNRIHRLGE